jgi:hypothetical protein
MWKETVVTYLKLLSQNFPGRSENTMETALKVAGFPAGIRSK